MFKILDFYHRFYEGLELLSVRINSVPLPLIQFPQIYY